MGVNQRGQGTSPEEFGMGMLMQIVHKIFKKYTAQNSPKHAVSSEKIQFLGKGA